MTPPLLVILLALGCGIALGMIGLATMQAFARRDALNEHYDEQGK